MRAAKVSHRCRCTEAGSNLRSHSALHPSQEYSHLCPFETLFPNVNTQKKRSFGHRRWEWCYLRDKKYLLYWVSAPLFPFTTQSPHCVCSSTPPELSLGGWPGWAQQWRDPGCGLEGPWEGVQTESSRGSSACGLGWRTRLPAGWARSSPSLRPPGMCSWLTLHRVRLCPPSYTSVSDPAPACPVWIWPGRTPQ